MYNANGPEVNLSGNPVVVTPPTAPNPTLCAPGGTSVELKGCVDIEIPMTATVGGRWKFLDAQGKLRGDVELNLGWEHWGAKCDYTTDPGWPRPE